MPRTTTTQYQYISPQDPGRMLNRSTNEGREATCFLPTREKRPGSRSPDPGYDTRDYRGMESFRKASNDREHRYKERREDDENGRVPQTRGANETRWTYKPKSCQRQETQETRHPITTPPRRLTQPTSSRDGDGFTEIPSVVKWLRNVEGPGSSHGWVFESLEPLAPRRYKQYRPSR
jgi:hypothetical protein